MRAPAFWEQPPGLLAVVLAPLGALYGAITLWRMARPGACVDLPVICVGNLTAGGAGKTPAVLAILARLVAMGRRPAVLTRGYGGRARGPLLVDPARHAAAFVGDEPLLLARRAPVVVARDRLAGARFAEAAGADVIVMDDGFQNPRLAKDLSLVVVDGATGVGNGSILPAGPLRAPADGQLRFAHAMLVLGEGEAGRGVAARALRHGVTVFHGRLVPDPAVVASLAGQPLLAFAGIGRPGKFAETLRHAGLDVRGLRSFPDHHPFTAAELATLGREAEKASLRLVTTEKDAVRLPPTGSPPVAVVPVTLTIDDMGGFDALLGGALRRDSTRSPTAPLNRGCVQGP